ncbi:hypothetical protein [Kutzneria chonburiensis]|uniref:Uncharacterized protein n=1 Tax=Kutzneria chonburiensis TaxID=1483604 RepID=A0ABV6N3G4_9PSEU|nr:hypothetical protein [Kutzneria chonburiensis]
MQIASKLPGLLLSDARTNMMECLQIAEGLIGTSDRELQVALLALPEIGLAIEAAIQYQALAAQNFEIYLNRI